MEKFENEVLDTLKPVTQTVCTVTGFSTEDGDMFTATVDFDGYKDVVMDVLMDDDESRESFEKVYYSDHILEDLNGGWIKCYMTEGGFFVRDFFRVTE